MIIKMKTLYLDCGMGAAGDMLTAALLELLPDAEGFMAQLNALEIPGVTMQKEKVSKCGGNVSPSPERRVRDSPPRRSTHRPQEYPPLPCPIPEGDEQYAQSHAYRYGGDVDACEHGGDAHVHVLAPDIWPG